MRGELGRTPLAVGIEVGSNRILAGIFGADLRCLKKVRRSTKPERGVDVVTDRIVCCVHDVTDEADVAIADVRAIGVAIPGLATADRRGVIESSGLGWRDFPLGEKLEYALGVPVVVENDGNLATLGVWSAELECKPARMLGIFVGNHIGGGWIVDGRLCGGFAESAGQLGHMVLDPHGAVCRCGNRGCFEGLASRQAVFDRIEAAISSGRSTQITEARAKLGRLRNKDLRQAFRSGDPLVKEVVATASHWVGVAIGTLVQSLKPDVVVLGGEMIDDLREEMLSAIVQAARDHAVPGALDQAQIFASSMGDDASISGAAWLARRLTAAFAGDGGNLDAR